MNLKHPRAVPAALLGFLALVAATAAVAKETVTVTDLAGRTVQVAVPVEHMVLGEGRFLPSLAILDRDDPTRRVVGMMAEFKRLDPATWAQYRARFPGIEDIPPVGAAAAATFSVEQAFAVRPDVAVFGLASGHGPSDRHKSILDQFASAGIPVVIIDFRMDPLVNTPRSLRLLGRLMGREAEAEEFLAFYTAEMDRVRDRLRGVAERPGVFLESRVGLSDECCEAVGQAMMGRFIEWAGGRNAFGDLIPGTHGRVNVEHLIVHQPDVYIGTAIGSALTREAAPQRIALGAGTDAETARASLARAVARTGPAQLAAVKDGRAYAIWHHFYNTPMHVAAVQAMAKWLHPDLFQDLDPRETLETFFARFQPVDLDGVYWIGLRPEGPAR